MLPGQGRGTAHYTAVKSHKLFGADGRDSETCRCMLGSQVHLRAGEAPSLQQHQDKCRESIINTAAVNLPGCGKEPAARRARGCWRSKAAVVEESGESSPGKEQTGDPSIPASPEAAPLDGGAHPPLPPPASAQPTRIPRSPVSASRGTLKTGTHRRGTVFKENPRDNQSRPRN